METTFIQEVCKAVKQQYEGKLHTVTIIVPAKRSVRFFINAFVDLFAQKGQVGLLPSIITLNDFTDKFSPYHKLSQVELVFHFYQVYCKLEENPDPFEKFYTWAPSLLADFNELDNYLLDPIVLYRDLRNIKEIEEWSFGEGTLSIGQQKLNDFWLKMPQYYAALKQYLEQHQLAYSGMTNRYIAEHIFTLADNSTFVFAGFNALTQCETQIIKYLVENKAAQFYIDADEYYTKNNHHEAGLFIREHVKHFTKGIHFINAKALLTHAKKIDLYECNGETMQCAAVMQIIGELNEEQLKSTAIVLCNEQLLPVLINSFPAQMDKVNVTMGWPLRYTHLNDFCVAYFDLCQQCQRQGKYIKPAACAQFIQAASKFFGTEVYTAQVMQSLHELKSFFVHKGILDLLTAATNSIVDVLNALQQVLRAEIEHQTNDVLRTEICMHFVEALHKLATLPDFEQSILSWYIFKQLFSKFTRNYPLAFVGEPFSGVQVMGMLETRALDFENIFILSANEGYLPAQNIYTGYIPYDLRAYNKLPGKAEQDAVFAYYFYRLLQRASNVHLFYNAQSELLQQAEKSRYVLQLERELAELNKGLVMQNRVLDYALEHPVAKLPIEKTTFYFERINEMLTSGISASALNTFNKCQLDFYHKYILGFRETQPQGVADESVIGNITHLYFNKLLEPVIEKRVTVDLFKEAIPRLEADLFLITSHYFPAFDFSSGQNFLALEMAKKMAFNFLKRQSDDQFQYALHNKILLGTEISLETAFVVSGKQYKLKGTVDLLLTDGDKNYYVYDFKTGKAVEADLRLGSRTVVGAKAFSGKDKYLQMLVYHRLVRDNYNVKDIKAQIIPLASGANMFLSMDDKQMNADEMLEQLLEEIITDMLNQTVLIEHNKRSKFCDFCL